MERHSGLAAWGLRESTLENDETGCRLLLTESVLPARVEKIFVVDTGSGATVAALKAATRWADQLDFRIELIVPQIVPYPLAPETPATSVEFIRARIRQLAAAVPVSNVLVCLCRDPFQALTEILPSRSVVVIGSRKRLLVLASSHRLARKLRRRGHSVIEVISR